MILYLFFKPSSLSFSASPSLPHLCSPSTPKWFALWLGPLVLRLSVSVRCRKPDPQSLKEGQRANGSTPFPLRTQLTLCWPSICLPLVPIPTNPVTESLPLQQPISDGPTPTPQPRRPTAQYQTTPSAAAPPSAR